MSIQDKRRRPSTAAAGGGVRRPIEPDLLERALTHRSYAYENGGLPTNERLEFLGDSVLGVVITSALFHNHPDLPEGQLAKLRASVVNMHALADVARALGPQGWAAPAARQGRGDHRRPDKGEHPGGHAGGRCSARSTWSTAWTRGGVIHRLFDPLMAESAGAARRWTGRQACRS
jgi:ribonuclease-3